MIRKRNEDGFINPQYEKLEMQVGGLALFLLLVSFLALLGAFLFGL